MRSNLTLLVVWFIWLSVERYADAWLRWIVPFYSTFKLLVLFSVLAGRGRVAEQLFYRLVAPTVRPYEPVIDALFTAGHDVGAFLQFTSSFNGARILHALQRLWSRLDLSSSPPQEAKQEPAENDPPEERYVPPPATRRGPKGQGGSSTRIPSSRSTSLQKPGMRKSSSQMLRRQAEEAVEEQRSITARLAALPPVLAPPTAPQGAIPSPPVELRNYAYLPPSPASPMRKLNAAEVLQRHGMLASQDSPGSNTIIINDALSPQMPGFLAKTPAIPQTSSLRHELSDAEEEDAPMEEDPADDTFIHKPQRRRKTALVNNTRLSNLEDLAGADGLDEVMSPPAGYVLESESDAPSESSRAPTAAKKRRAAAGNAPAPPASVLKPESKRQRSRSATPAAAATEKTSPKKSGVRALALARKGELPELPAGLRLEDTEPAPAKSAKTLRKTSSSTSTGKLKAAAEPKRALRSSRSTILR